MSVQAGIWQFDGQPIERRLVTWLSDRVAQWGPDGESRWVDGSVALVHRPFHTTAESRRERQPVVSPQGFVLTWDGRLDNRAELAAELNAPLDSTDADLVVKGFEIIGTRLFRRILGDWALSIWFPGDRKLILAQDIFAVKHLYYHQTETRVLWSTIMNPIVQQPGASWRLDYHYIAGYLGYIPDAFRTPYDGISAVPPASWVEIAPGKNSVHEYWTLVPKRIRYRTEDEYDAHFRDVFRQAVSRRLRTDAPVLAELSGGMDSSSIVCMADDILTREGAATPRIDTLTYYDDRESTGDERVRARYVEEKRGRAGHHFDMGALGRVEPMESGTFAPVPGYFQFHVMFDRDRSKHMREAGSRVVLSGRSGDEFCGGWYEPAAYLADRIVRFQWRRLIQESSEWALRKRVPLVNILGKSLLLLQPLWVQKRFLSVQPWIDPEFARRYRLRQQSLVVEKALRDLSPGEIHRVRMYWITRRLMAYCLPCLAGCSEFRFPYTDRDFVEYMSAIPSEQLLRPGRRRPLMRRALRGLVPEPVLENKRKSVVTRQGLVGPPSLSTGDIATALGITRADGVANVFDAARAGNVSDIVGMNKLFGLEFWLPTIPLALTVGGPGGALDHAACNIG